MIGLHRVEPGQRIPDAGGVRVLLDRRAGQRGVVLAVRLGAAHHVVAPAHMGLVEKIGEIRPGVDGLAVRAGIRRSGPAAIVGRGVGRPLLRLGLQRVAAARWIVVLRAVGRPFRYEEQVGRQAPRGVGLEHVVLEDEILGVGPVVREVASRVIPHHVGLGGIGARRVGRIQAAFPAGLGLPDEPVHLPAIDVGRCVNR